MRRRAIEAGRHLHLPAGSFLERSGRPLRSALLACGIASLGPAVSAQVPGEGAFVVEMGTDTFTVENFVRSPTRVTVDMSGPAIGRTFFEFGVEADGTVRRLTLSAWAPGAADDVSPAQEAELELRGDSAIVDVRTAAGEQTQRLATTEGAVPYLNPSFVLLEQVIRRAMALEGEAVEVPLFMVQGGQTLPATVRRIGEDSVTVTLAGSEVRAAVDGEGSIRSAAIPAQNLRITRVDGRHVTSPAAAPPDYSAPAGAPYRAVEVSIETREGHTLVGTLTRPPLDAPTAAAVLITGSGAQDRDQAIPMVRGYRPFREIADTLSRRGVAVLRLDDRGFGASTGDFAAATSADFADDIREAVAHLRGRADIDGGRVFLIGHSEGGLIAPMVAAEDPSIRGIVLIAAPAWSGREIIAHQQRFAMESAAVISEDSRDSALVAAAETVEEAAAGQPWLLFFLDYQPLPTARSVADVPVLILHGETDRQVTVDQAETLAEAFRTRNRDVTLRTFPEVNHLMLPDPDGDPAGYASLEERRLAPGVRGTLVDWVIERAR